MSIRPWPVLVALFGALCLVVTIWVSIDRHPPEWDYANHLERALDCHRTLANPAADRFAEIMGASSFYPPLAICAAGILYFALPVTTLTAQAAMLAFLAVGLLAVYGLGRYIADPATGVLAAFFLGTAPFVVFSLLNFQLDLPLTGMVALALYALVRAEAFSRPPWTVALGLIWGLGLLTKPTFPVYALAPVLWTVGQAARGGARWRRFIWLGLAVVIAVVLRAFQVTMSAFMLPAPPPAPGLPLSLALSYPPSRADWQHARILDDIARASGGRPVTVSVVPNYPTFSVSNFRYEAKRRGLPFTMLRPWGATPFGVDFVIVKSGDLGPDFSIAKARRIMQMLAAPCSNLARLFPVVGQYTLPDGSRAELRARRIGSPGGVTPEALAARIAETREGFVPSLVRDPEHLRIDLRYRPEAILRGELVTLTVTADAASVGELTRTDRLALRVRNIRVALQNVVFDPVEVLERRVLEPLNVGAVSIERAVVTQADLQRVIDDQRRAVRMAVELGDGAAQVRASGLGPRIGARDRVLLARH